MDEPPAHLIENEADRQQLRAEFEQLWHANRNEEAMPYFARISEDAYARITKADTFSTQTPSIITSFAPKSGGTFLHNRLLQVGFEEYHWFFPDYRCMSYTNIEAGALRRYLRGGCACHSHARPLPNVWEPLEKAGVKRVWVHLRNPAECNISSYHHHLGDWEGCGGITEEAIRQVALLPVKLDDRDVFIADQIDWHCDWAAQWLTYAAEHPDKVVLSFYD